MKTIFDKFRLKLHKDYGIAIAISMIIHGGIFGLLVVSLPPTPVKYIVPLHLTARLIEAKQLKPSASKTIERDRIKAAETHKAKELNVQRKKEQALARKKTAEQKKQIDLKRKQQEAEAKEKIEAQKKSQELEKQQAAKRQKELEEFMMKIAEEQTQQEQEQAAQEQVEKDELEIAYYSNLLITRMSLHWNRPASALNNMVTVLEIHLSPFGDLQGFKIINRSGNDAFDRSAIQAIKLGTPITELKQLDPRIFEKYFRRFTFKFSPEDLMK
ncbi:MAG: cell envelope integrity protein TolA [Candidatus Endonucleobacter bathymodioli]|uniref:Cell envelope integrity protein TolA n=1 Tax=Candidatus Endonucleibacter bathymodioli TaxID=539814 RepID=A0AA90NNB0_9GAMM|nr:cell envelope integrity protein TolA [Candidatus Endonucleobacter bathymodioli]